MKESDFDGVGGGLRFHGFWDTMCQQFWDTRSEAVPWIWPATASMPSL
jgi:hypothetical protein